MIFWASGVLAVGAGVALTKILMPLIIYQIKIIANVVIFIIVLALLSKIE
jgi:hypothetical protein